MNSWCSARHSMTTKTRPKISPTRHREARTFTHELQEHVKITHGCGGRNSLYLWEGRCFHQRPALTESYHAPPWTAEAAPFSVGSLFVVGINNLMFPPPRGRTRVRRWHLSEGRRAASPCSRKLLHSLSTSDICWRGGLHWPPGLKIFSQEDQNSYLKIKVTRIWHYFALHISLFGFFSVHFGYSLYFYCSPIVY